MAGLGSGPFTVAAVILFVASLIFVHELGHFLAAKLFDIKVEKFSLGFGPPIFSFKRGETTYQIALLPLGGFVKMSGDYFHTEDVAPADKSRALFSAPLYQRVIILLAGPAFNLVFPILCFFAYVTLGPLVVSPVVGQVEPDRPADKAGLLPGDRIVAIDGKPIWSFQRLKELVSQSPERSLRLQVLRGDQTLDLEATPDRATATGMFGEPESYGVLYLTPERSGSRVGVADAARNQGGFVTGDRVVSVDGRPVEAQEQLLAALVAAAGRTVSVVVTRPEPKRAGAVLHAADHRPVTLQVPVPESVASLADLGLAPSENFVRRVVPGSAAEKAGLRPGDRIVEANGRSIRLFWAWLRIMQDAADQPVAVVVERGGERIALELKNDPVPCVEEVTKNTETFWHPGVGFGVGEQVTCAAVNQAVQTSANWESSAPIQTEIAHLSLPDAMAFSVRETWRVIELTATALYKLFAGDISTDNVGGPIILFKIAAQAAEAGISAYLRTLALISVNIGLVNLLPIPIFDGGNLVFCAIEAIKRRPISMRVREAASLVGLVLVVMLFILAIRNDLMNLGRF